MKQAIILCSGGLDSVVSAHCVKRDGKHEKIKILFFDYGQRNLLAEKNFSEICAKELDAEFLCIGLPELGAISTSLLNSKEKAKEISREDLKDSKNESDKWYVPCRNLLFLSYALSIAEADSVGKKIESDIFLGFKDEGSEGYPDTTKEFVELVDKISKSSTTGKFNIVAPVIEKDKEDIVKLGNTLKVDFSKTFSCYSSEDIHCGTCLACRLRQEGFYWANVNDPTDYKEKLKDFRLAK